MVPYAGALPQKHLASLSRIPCEATGFVGIIDCISCTILCHGVRAFVLYGTVYRTLDNGEAGGAAGGRRGGGVRMQEPPAHDDPAMHPLCAGSGGRPGNVGRGAQGRDGIHLVPPPPPRSI